MFKKTASKPSVNGDKRKENPASPRRQTGPSPKQPGEGQLVAAVAVALAAAADTQALFRVLQSLHRGAMAVAVAGRSAAAGSAAVERFEGSTRSRELGGRE